MLTRVLFIYTFLLFSLIAYGQTEAEQISNFQYGLQGEDVITSIQASGVKLYAGFDRIYGDQGSGLLSLLDQSSGAPIPVIDPDVTDWRISDRGAVKPRVYEMGEMTLASVYDPASGMNLYRIDGEEAVLLHTNNQFDRVGTIAAANFSPVVLDGIIYFISGSIPERVQVDAARWPRLQLWRTDGTPEETYFIQDIPRQERWTTVSLLASRHRLLIVTKVRQLNTFSTYRPGDLTLTPLTQQGELVTTTCQDIVYYDGYFYLSGVNSSSLVDGAIYRVSDETLETTIVSIPNMGGGSNYESFRFQALGGELYFVARDRNQWSGVDLFRMSGDSAVLVQNTDFIGDDVPISYLQLTAVADTLYFINFHSNTWLTAWSYVKESGETTDIFETYADDRALQLVADQRFVYLNAPLLGEINRFDRWAQTMSRTEYRPAVAPGLAYSSGFAVTPAGAYVLADGPTSSGLYLLATNTDTLTQFDQYRTWRERDAASVLGYNREAETLLIRANTFQMFSAEENNLVTVSLPDGVDTSSFQPVLEVDGETFYHGRNANFRNQKIYRLRDGEFIPLPVAYDGFTFSQSVSLPFGRSISNSIRLTQLRVDGVSDLDAVVLFTVKDDTVRTDKVNVVFFGNPGFENTYRDTLFAQEVNPDDTLSTVYVITYFGDTLYNFEIPQNAVVIAMNASGAFAEYQNGNYSAIRYYTTSGEPFVEMPFGEYYNAYGNSGLSGQENYYIVNNRLLFVGDTPDNGREWLVADPYSDDQSVQILTDINPGIGFGTVSLEAHHVTADGMYFSANDGVNGNELWFTDGTTAGTRMLEINPGPNSANPSDFKMINGVLFFAANGPAGYELYRLRPEENIPQLVVDLNAGAGSSHPNSFYCLGDQLYFMGRGSAGATYELYSIPCSLAVATADVASVIPARIFPNPSHVDGTITVEAPAGERIIGLEVYSQQGQLLRRVATNAESIGVNLSGLPVGTYWLRSAFASGRFSVGGVVRQ